VAVVCIAEPDSELRAGYFDCKTHSHKTWMVPSGYDLAAKKIEYSRYKIPTCPREFIWLSTRRNFHSPAVSAAMRYPKARLISGGALQQPANVGQIVEIVRMELRAFRELRSAARQK